MRIGPKQLAIAALAIILLAAIGTFGVNALRQPEAADYKRLDTQRQAVDISMNVYSPVFDGFARDYNAVFAEEWPADEATAVKTSYQDTLERDGRINAERLNRMASSVALKEPEVKRAFDTFKQRYGAVISYYEQYAHNVAHITESIAGRCNLHSNLNVAKSSLADDYTKAADACLSALAAAKEGSDEPTTKLLSDVEALVKERRDAFKESIGKEGFEQTITRTTALVGLLDINADLKKIQATYEATTKTEYTKLVNDANRSNEALQKALEPFMTAKGKI